MNVARDGGADPAILRGQRVSTGFFDILRVRPLLGRIFTAGDEVHGREDVAVISYGLWQRRFGGADVLGQPLRTADRTIEIVGVTPDGFEYPVAAAEPTEISRRSVRPSAYSWRSWVWTCSGPLCRPGSHA